MTKEKDLVVEIKEFLDMASTAESENRDAWLEDIRFYNGEQWPDALKRAREQDPNGPRPCLTINKLPLHVHQVTNDVRQNSPAVKCHPVDDKADVKLAEILNGVIRHIEYQSDADVAYQTANFYQTVGGVGYWRIITKVENEETNEQDIYIRAINNIFSVYFDPNSECPVGSDAERVLITSEMSKHEFRERYPDAEETSFQDGSTGDKTLNTWAEGETIRIAEYWYKEEKSTNVLLVDGEEGVEEITEEDYWKRYQGDEMRPQVRGTRPKTTEKVCWVKTNGAAILEKGEWAGKWIPIIRVPGEIVEVEGKKFFRGLVNNAKDSQRMYNYWVSAETELIALQPKAPFIGAAGAFDGYEDKWAMANVANLPYLEYNPLDINGNPIPAPQRQPFSGSPNGVVNAKMGASDDIKATTGQHDASLGMKSNETSGRAIMARQKEGDTGTYHFVDNMSKAIRHTGRIIIDLIPKIYDTKRVVRIVGEDGTVDQAKFDPAQPQPVRKVRDFAGNVKTIYNPSIGKYDVTVSVGPSYNTKRAEAFDAMTQLVQSNPQLWMTIGDLIVKNMDWPGADSMAKRLKAMLPPQIAQLEQADEDGGLPPEAMQQIEGMQQQLMEMQQGVHDAVQAIQERDQQIAQLQQELEQSKAGGAIDLRVKAVEAEADIAKAEADKVKAMADVEKTRMELQRMQGGEGVDMGAFAAIQQQIEALSQSLNSIKAEPPVINFGTTTQVSQEPKRKVITIQAPSGAIYTGAVETIDNEVE